MFFDGIEDTESIRQDFSLHKPSPEYAVIVDPKNEPMLELPKSVIIRLNKLHPLNI